MVDYGVLERTLTDALQLTRRPVAVAFQDQPPDGVARLAGSQPSGCTFWSLAAEGRVFYTAPEDHYNCPIGSYTHNIPLPKEREHELNDTLSIMSDIGYLRMAEVPQIPRLAKTPAVTVYAPLARTPLAPDAVIVTGTPGGLMLLHEAATRTGVESVSLLGRPTCTAIPAALESGLASSLGCVGNRIYTALGDEEFYSVIRADKLALLSQEISTITAANVMLSKYHKDRQAAITA
ncbi:MAG TPA: DUF169 domain-containing protein [Vicinamibacterales bacterium]|nr:DUF169 domain-containing protein [Vicinamibacterales bacterium]